MKSPSFFRLAVTAIFIATMATNLCDAQTSTARDTLYVRSTLADIGVALRDTLLAASTSSGQIVNEIIVMRSDVLTDVVMVANRIDFGHAGSWVDSLTVIQLFDALRQRSVLAAIDAITSKRDSSDQLGHVVAISTPSCVVRTNTRHSTSFEMCGVETLLTSYRVAVSADRAATIVSRIQSAAMPCNAAATCEFTATHNTSSPPSLD